MTSNGGLSTRELTSVTLEGSTVRLEPIRREHGPLLWEAVKDVREEIFRWWPYPTRSFDDFKNFIETILSQQELGTSVGFVTVERNSGSAVGSTRFMNIDAPNRRVEIGSTWIVPAWQRTAVNTETKYLMLRHAFEQWKCLRVEFKTDVLNQQSRAAILRLGAKEEGIFRKHVVTWNGRVRDSVYFSIVNTEWLEIKSNLEQRLRARF